MKDEAITGVRALEIQEGFATGVRVSQLKTQLNLTNMLLNLPAVIKEIEDQLEHRQATLLKMKASQEGAEI
jgi:hypothetical protein